MLVKRSLALVILAQLSTAALIPRQSESESIWMKSPLKSFVVSFAGQYAIANCGPDNTALLHTFLDEIYAALQPAVQDAESTQGPAFQTFFSAENGASVSNLLAKIAEGAPAFPADKYTNGAPIMVCISGRGQISGIHGPSGAPFDAFDKCADSTVASSLSGTKFIVICPNFWTSPQLVNSPPAPPASNVPAVNCPRLSRNQKQFGGTPNDRHGAAYLVQYKVWVVLEEIVHSYIFAAYGTGSHPEVLDIYDANAAFALSAQDSLLNAPSYVLYVASKQKYRRFSS